MVIRRPFAVLLALSLALVAALSIPALASASSGVGERPGLAPLHGQDDPEAIDGRYVVVFEPGTAAADVEAARQAARAQGADVGHSYETALTGFAATLPGEALRGLRRNPNVSYVEADRPVEAMGQQSPAPWNLDRIDQRDLPLDDTYRYNATGDGVRAHIIDTGIRKSHDQFDGRAEHGVSVISDGNGSEDCNGHGTHIAGTVGGTDYGVAKEATLVAVRVLDCNGAGTISGVIAGVDWVTQDARAVTAPAVANMSLGGPASAALDDAVRQSVAAGVTYAVAGGSSGADACDYSPSRIDEALTVAATDQSDNAASFNNHGDCLDIYAPGVSITSAWHTSDSVTNTISGTSTASPHVAGVAALYLEDNPAASPATVMEAILKNATRGRVNNPAPGSPNLLLYSLFDDGDPGPDPACLEYDERYPGHLEEGQTDFQPDGGYYYAGSGRHEGCLSAPDGAAFDLSLLRWNGWNWQVVATGTTADGVAEVSYVGSAGYYQWAIHAATGSGDYVFALTRP